MLKPLLGFPKEPVEVEAKLLEDGVLARHLNSPYRPDWRKG
jgi:hypothetical protein